MAESDENTQQSQTPTSSNEPQRVQDLPNWAQTLISETRQEAANYRTRLSQAKDEARGEVKAEFETQLKDRDNQLADFKQQLSDKDLNYSKLEVALSTGMQGNQAVYFAERLRGTTVEELKADAEQALKVFGAPANEQQQQQNGNSRATDPSQGLGSEPPKSANQVMGDFLTSRLSKK